RRCARACRHAGEAGDYPCGLHPLGTSAHTLLGIRPCCRDRPVRSRIGPRRRVSADYHSPMAVSEPVPALLPRRVVSAGHAEHPARGNLLLPRMDSAAGTLCTRGVRTCLAKIVGRQFNSPPCLETLMRPALLLLGLSLLLPLGCHRSAPTKELTESPTVAPAPSSGVY